VRHRARRAPSPPARAPPLTATLTTHALVDGFWLPSVLTRLGKSKGEAGAIGSALEMSYGACSLVNGVLIDARSPRTLLIVGLLLTCLINVAVSGTDLLPAMAALWAINGAVQSLGWPCVTNVRAPRRACCRRLRFFLRPLPPARAHTRGETRPLPHTPACSSPSLLHRSSSRGSPIPPPAARGIRSSPPARMRVPLLCH